MSKAADTERELAVLAILTDLDRPAGVEAGAVNTELGGRYGGRSAAGVLNRLERAGDVVTVPRTDGRMRPLRYRVASLALDEV